MPSRVSTVLSTRLVWGEGVGESASPFRTATDAGLGSSWCASGLLESSESRILAICNCFVPGKHAGERFLMRAGEGKDILAVVEAGTLF